ncbi:MAG: CRISPR-associated endonuclease Cas1 [Bacteroidota bacterium]|nr:CRISPR-associated endonuclease Cas1 [Bacteroidota bacterium]
MELHISALGGRLSVKDFIFIVKLPIVDAQIDNSTDTYSTEQLSPDLVKCIYLYPNSSISSNAMSLAVNYQIPIFLFDKDLVPQGQIWSHKYGSIASIRTHQHLFFRSKEGAIWVKDLIIFKLKQQQYILQQFIKSSTNAANYIANAIILVENWVPTVDKSQLEILRGYEGVSAKHYFGSIGQSLPPAFRFDLRTRRPALDPFNAMLNYLYSILYFRVENSLISAGLDPYCSILHVSQYNKPTLVYDFMEMYRIWADSLAISLVNKNQVNFRDFQRNNITGEYLINIEARRVIVTAFNLFINNTVKRGKVNLSRKNHIANDAKILADHLLNHYHPPSYI